MELPSQLPLILNKEASIIVWLWEMATLPERRSHSNHLMGERKNKATVG